jgi:class 3 adenylate cyclase
MRQQLVSGLGRMETPSEPEVGAVPAICAVVEIGNLLEAPELMDAPYRQLSLARSRGMMFSSGWVFLLPRVLGVAAAVLRSWEDAEKHFSEAISVAKRLGARPELARSCFDHAHMLTARGSEGDRDRAIDLLMEAHGLFAELGMRPLERSADELGARLGLVTPLVQRLEPVGSAGLSVGERVLLRSATSGDAGATPPDLTDVLQRIGLGRPAAEPPSTDEDAPPLILLMTDMEGFTELIQRQGARGAQEVIHTHNTILRDCLRDHIGTEIQHTGDGIFASFLSAARAVACAIAMQRELARHNREHPDSRIKIRVGLAAGAPVPEEGRLLGPSVNAAARICAHALGGQIVTSRDVVRFAGDVNVTDLGEVPLKGFKEPFHLQAIQW